MEEIIGLLCLGYLPLCTFLVIFVVVKTNKNFRRYFPLYALMFGMLAYCYEPTYEIDLSRYFFQLDYCRSIPFSHAFSWDDNGLVVKNFLFWVISKFEDNHILPLLSVTTVFSVSSYIAIKASEDSNIKIGKILLFQVMLMPMYATLSNVRNVTAFSLGILAVYRDLVCHKRGVKTLLLYILPCFMHIAGGVMLLIRLVLLLIKKHPRLGISLTLGIPSLSIALFKRVGHDVNLPGSVGKIVSRAIWKAYSSSVNTSDYAIERQSGGYFRACRAVMFVLCIVLLSLVLKQLKDKESKWRDYKLFCAIIIAITLIWIAMGTVKYWVFGFAVVISCAPVLVARHDECLQNRRLHDRHLHSQLTSSLILLTMVCRSALEIYFISRRIVISDYLNSVMLCNIWVIIYKAFVNLFAL